MYINATIANIIKRYWYAQHEMFLNLTVSIIAVYYIIEELTNLLVI